MKSQNTLSLVIKYTSLQAILSLTDKLSVHTSHIGLKSVLTTYTPYVLAQSIIECIRAIKPDLQQQKQITYTKSLALGIGLITSAYVNIGYNGINYVLSFSLTLLKSTANTLIIDKLNKLKTIDGVSVAVLINFIFDIPNIIMGLSSQPLTTALLFIASLGIMAVGNYKLIQSTEDVNIHYKDTKDKFSLNTRNNYTTALIISSFVTNLISNNPLIQSSLMLIVNPLIHWFMSSNMDTDELNKNLQYNGIYIDELKHGEETKECISHMIRKNSIKLGLVGAVTFIISNLLVKAFAISISPVMLAIMVNSFINVQFGVKSLIKSNLKGMKGFAI